MVSKNAGHKKLWKTSYSKAKQVVAYQKGYNAGYKDAYKDAIKQMK